MGDPLEQNPLLRTAVEVPTSQTFDIFQGPGKHDARWLECVEGLDAATKRMDEMAAKRRGMYFVLNLYNCLVLARTDTTSLAPWTARDAGAMFAGKECDSDDK